MRAARCPRRLGVLQSATAGTASGVAASRKTARSKVRNVADYALPHAVLAHVPPLRSAPVPRFGFKPTSRLICCGLGPSRAGFVTLLAAFLSVICRSKNMHDALLIPALTFRHVRWLSLHTCWRCCERRTACSYAGASATGRISGTFRLVRRGVHLAPLHNDDLLMLRHVGRLVT